MLFTCTNVVRVELYTFAVIGYSHLIYVVMLAFSAGAALHTHRMNEIILTHAVQHAV